jgi:hypothetical protein
MMPEGPGRSVDDLVALAQARFPDLSEAELKLLREAPEGEMAWCGPSRKDDDPANDPAKPDKWGSDREIRARTIRAGLIRWLCVDRDAKSAVDPRGIQVHAARITGELDLSYVSVPFPLRLGRCRFTDDAKLISTDLPTLNLAGSRVQSVTADGIHVKGNVFLNNELYAEGAVRLLGAHIGGDLDCSDGSFKNPGNEALNVDRASVKGSVFFNNGFNAEGEVRLVGAQIGCDLSCGGGTFNNPGERALSFHNARVEGSVYLRCGFTADGAVGLLYAQIRGSLDCNGGTFKNPRNHALSADGANVRGDVSLSAGFSAEGEVRLHGAQIDGGLNCIGGTFKNPGKHALGADGANVKGCVFLRDGFSAEGEVRLPGAQIGGELDCSGGMFSEMNAESARIVASLLWRGVKAAKTATLNLTNASAGSLVDDKPSWPDPEKGKLFLDGFVYGHISGESPRDAKTRLGWLDRQEPFTPKPYRQLAKVLREEGRDSDASKVLFEMEGRRRKDEDRRRREEIEKRPLPPLYFKRFRALAILAFRINSHLRSRCVRLWDWVLKWAIGYGFYPSRAIVGLLLLTALGWGLFRYGYFSGAVTPTDTRAYHFFCDHGWSPDHYQRFTASIYSLENSLPFVNLGQKDHWTPDPNPRGSRWLPGFLRWFRWGQVLLGWLLATLFVAGVTRVVRKE